MDATLSPSLAPAPPDQPAGGMLMRGNYFGDDSYLTTDVRTGVTRNRAGTRIITLTQDFLLGLRNALVTECGPAADLVLKTCGKTWGRQFAVRMENELSEFYSAPLSESPMAVFEACLVEAFSRHGWGRVKLDWTMSDRGLILAELEGAVFAEIIGTSERPVESLSAGVLAGMFGNFSGQDIDCVQTACKSCGAATSRFVMGLSARIAPATEAVEKGRTHEQVVAELAESKA
jgi:predicted hydrocarbon binding protein